MYVGLATQTSLQGFAITGFISQVELEPRQRKQQNDWLSSYGYSWYKTSFFQRKTLQEDTFHAFKKRLFIHLCWLSKNLPRQQKLNWSNGHYFISYFFSILIALGYGLDDRGSRVLFPAGAGTFSLHHRVQNGSGAHPASYPMSTRGSFAGGKAAGAWSWPLTSI
jgi:hypothetical protein